jgi:hypothetical protein
MNLIVSNIQWIMLVAGVLTLTMLQAVFAPKAALKGLFGEALEGPVANIIVRNWGFLIALTAAFVIYAAFHPPLRAPALILSGAGKLCFVALVFAQGARYAKRQAFVAASIDLFWVVVFALYLVAAQEPPGA